MSLARPLLAAFFLKAEARGTCTGQAACSGDHALLQRSNALLSRSHGQGSGSLSTVTCPETQAGEKSGSLSPEIDECSGLAASRKNEGRYWTHNDSGGKARLFAIDVKGTRRKTVNVGGAYARDWEDIDVGPGPVDGETYIYIADIGDNYKQRASIQIYRLPEPTVTGNEWEEITVPAQKFEVQYPDGARDCEAIFVDQGPAAVAQGTSGRVYVISKHYGYSGDIYWVDLPETPASTLTFTKGSRLNHGGTGWPAAVTAADINPEGTLIAVRAYDQLIIYPRQEGSSVDEALQGNGCQVSRHTERQGESVAFGSDGSHYLTVSEGRRPAVWYFAIGPAPEPLTCGGVLMQDVDKQCPEDGSGCKVLANNMLGKTCHEYCTMNGLDCVNGWEEEDENCVDIEELGCNKSYGTTSDLLCQCEPMVM
eukprot:TRINITY_DN143_c0_g2_i1.p1 TRINITY_DN143_c0_g2~~TRINITY_DN143_c0_g2_i1.p1  ORF type:complete len:442 (+),score=70.97 TRINITY_DN143_c0_g2_i1:56-1327(+)